MKKNNKRKKFFYILEKVVSKLARVTFNFLKTVVEYMFAIPYELFYLPLKKYIINFTWEKEKKNIFEMFVIYPIISFIVFAYLILLAQF